MSFFQEQNADSAEKISPITLCTIFQPKKSNLVGFKKKPLQLVKRETQKNSQKRWSWPCHHTVRKSEFWFNNYLDQKWARVIRK